MNVEIILCSVARCCFVSISRFVEISIQFSHTAFPIVEKLAIKYIKEHCVSALATHMGHLGVLEKPLIKPQWEDLDMGPQHPYFVLSSSDDSNPQLALTASTMEDTLLDHYKAIKTRVGDGEGAGAGGKSMSCTSDSYR